jgi:hypothetical protein
MQYNQLEDEPKNMHEPLNPPMEPPEPAKDGHGQNQDPGFDLPNNPNNGQNVKNGSAFKCFDCCECCCLLVVGGIDIMTCFCR